MRIEAELFGSPVQFPKGFKACLIERWVSPPRRRLRPSNRDSPLFPGDVLPLQSLISHARNPQKKSSVAAT
jgi:hypothetical protein